MICALHAALPANSTAQHSTAQHSTAQHSTAQHSTAQHSTAQHSTAQQTKLSFVKINTTCIKARAGGAKGGGGGRGQQCVGTHPAPGRPCNPIQHLLILECVFLQADTHICRLGAGVARVHKMV